MSHTAVVILNYNGEKLLQQFLPSVVQNSGNAEIIVADNGSTDQSLLILSRDFPSVRIITLDENYGFCGGYNRALNQVKADYYVLLNSDVEVTPNWLDSLLNLLDRDNQIAAVQPKILSYHNRNKFEHAGAAGGLIDSLGYPFCRGRIFNSVEEDKGQYNDEVEIFWATGACMIVRSKLYHQFNGLDEDFFAHMEEIDLCWKLHRSGYKIYYSGNSTVYHVGAGTLDYSSPRKTYLNFRNGLSLIFKHLDSGEILYKIPFRILLDWLAAFIFLIKFQPKNTLAVLRAHLDFIKNLNRNRAKRNAIRKEYPTYPRDVIHKGIILFDYFLKGKKYYR
ncbi:MAG TPA: glycosyltransferase family 2 protein [Chryseolinea sp.]|nr:glycosyltransferase family 2 protein [Chryseolinea sp.]